MTLAKSLRNSGYQIILIDKNNFHTFQPLLYQVATAGLEPDSVAYPLRKIFNHYEDFHFRMAEAVSINSENRTLLTDRGEVEFDYLVIATGAETNYFGNKNIEHLGMAMKSVREALDLRSIMLQNFEDALITNDVSEREQLMNIVVVGGGATGVELAGALAELKKLVLPKDYPDLDFRQMSVHLIEAGPQLLSAMSEDASKKAFEFLATMGVQIWLNTMVSDFSGKEVSISQNKNIPSKTLIWAAGVQGAPVAGIEVNKAK